MMQKVRSFPRYTWLIVILCYSFAVTSDRSITKLPKKAIAVFAGDIDNDNDIDIITGHEVSSGDIVLEGKSFAVLKNDGAGYFAISDTSKSYLGYQDDIFAVDINNDQWKELVTFYGVLSSGIVHRFLRIWYNDNGDFNEYFDVDLNTSDPFTGMSYCDFNGDGFIDIVLYANPYQIWGILYNDGNGNFESPLYYDLSYPPQHIECKDLNNDGKDEIIISGWPVEIYWYDSINGFTQTILDDAPFTRTKICDIDNDGDYDIVAFEFVPTFFTDVCVFRNDEGIFTKIQLLQFQPMAEEVLVSDFNNDSLPDLAFLFNNRGEPYGMKLGIQINYNDGNYQFNQNDSIIMYYGGEWWRHFTSADLDGNGFIDLAVVRYYTYSSSNTLELMYNDGAGNFQPTPVVSTYNLKSPTSFLCYPNPFDKTLNISYQSTTDKTEFVLYNSSGKQLKNSIIHSAPGNNDVSWVNAGNGIPAGVYFIAYRVNDKIINIQKVIKL